MAIEQFDDDVKPSKENIKKQKSSTPLLDNFGKDLTRMAEEGKLEPVIGREDEIERVIQILSRKKKNNPVLIGEPGCVLPNTIITIKQSFFKNPHKIIKEIKIIELFEIISNGFEGRIDILTNKGFEKIGDLYKKSRKKCFRIELENKMYLEASEDHLVQVKAKSSIKSEYLDGNFFIRLKNINIGDYVCTKDGDSKVLSISNIGVHDTYDLEVLSDSHIYESNGIFSHNTGKTAIVEGLAKKIIEKKTSVVLHGKRLVTLDLSLIVAGTKYRGQFEERMKAIMDEIEDNPDVILFIDELHTIIGAGNSMGALDVSNMIKPALARGLMQVIGATTIEEYKKSIEKDGAMERRFQKILVPEPSIEETKLILKQIKNIYEDFHNVTFDDETIDAAVDFADRFITNRFQPDKSIDIIDEAGARAHLDNIIIPKELEGLEKQLIELKNEKNKVVKGQEYEKAAKIRDKEKELVPKIEEFKLRWKEEQKLHKIPITVDIIAKVVGKMTGIPVTKIGQDEWTKLLKMEEELKKRVIGQDDAVTKVSQVIQRSRTGLSNPRKPLGNFLFLGNSGVGKTELAKALAEYLFNDESALIKLDMSEYMEPHSVSKLIGSPPGYVQSEEGGQLTEKVRNKPYSVVLFDEIEKAHPLVTNILLQLLDEGKLTDGLGKEINFKNTIIIMTSNAGTKELGESSPLGFNKSSVKSDVHTKSIIDKALGKVFRKETLNRIDEQIIFNTLSKENISKITDLHLDNFLNTVRNIGFKPKATKTLRDFIAEEGYSEDFGVRPVHRAITTYVQNVIAKAMLEKKIKSGDSFTLDYVKEEVVIIKNKEKN